MPRTLSIVACLLAGLGGSPAMAQSPMPLIELTASFHRIEAEVASTQPERMLGLMNRRAMSANHGMLFVFPRAEQHCMWMRNTFIPLSVAFIDDKGTIINIEEMKPQTETSHCAKTAARFALEMNSGWFAAKGMKAGTRLGGLEKVPAPR